MSIEPMNDDKNDICSGCDTLLYYDSRWRCNGCGPEDEEDYQEDYLPGIEAAQY